MTLILIVYKHAPAFCFDFEVLEVCHNIKTLSDFKQLVLQMLPACLQHSFPCA